ncbi:type I pullulanase [Bacillus sp. FJAT-44742]|uniref:type I pullulanase n=1 Tax=Bacillus sp. FJAT-44742 TaxID=2014005 RepID=UPI0012FF2180|nr:type I pullulanase [Bacillus sp. FJAT-44742]
MKTVLQKSSHARIKAWFETLSKIVVESTSPIEETQWQLVQKQKNSNRDTDILASFSITGNRLIFTLDYPLVMGEGYFVITPSGARIRVLSGSAVRTEEFDRLYAYHGNDLGAVWGPSYTEFAVWAPTAEKVSLLLYNAEASRPKISLLMNKTEKGVWRYTLKGNHEGLLYTYQVFVNGVWHETVDPYAKSLTANGRHGAVIRTSEDSLRPERPPFISPVDAIIYEAHVRDMTTHLKSGVREKGKYSGLAERGTRIERENITTALEHIIEMGVTHVQLLPVNDFGSVDENRPFMNYNWGYDATHHFSPEGSYATDPDNPFSRIEELKNLIHTFHEAGLRVVLDVVFNHVYIKEDSPFEKLVPGYYFRYDEHGLPSDGTGVGNDTASERAMMRKYIVDCISYWAEEYQVDGFRFDLMGIHDIKTMKAVRQAVNQIDSSILIYGEGWDMPTPIPYEEKAIMAHGKHLEGIGFFNDAFREAMKGSSFNIKERGFINGKREAEIEVEKYMHGSIPLQTGAPSLFTDPAQSINYIECHDNMTVWDQLKVSVPEANERLYEKMQRLALTAVLTAQGIPFIHAGQEFCRTKHGHVNSYNAPDWLNQMDWERKKQYRKTVEYVKGLIKIRKEIPALRLRDQEEIQKRFSYIQTPPHVVGFHIKRLSEEEDFKELIVFLNGAWEKVEVSLPKGIKSCQVIVDDQRASLIPLKTIDSSTIAVPAISATILYR